MTHWRLADRSEVEIDSGKILLHTRGSWTADELTCYSAERSRHDQRGRERDDSQRV